MPMQDLAMSMSPKTPKQRNVTRLLSPALIRQLLVAIGVAGTQQLTGVNAVFFYSSGIFKQAGLADGRIGNRKLILCGLAGMFCSAVGMTAALVGHVPALAIVFTALYVTTFSSSLGPLACGVMADIFPDDVHELWVLHLCGM
ncbi:hypothetical protein KXD40_007481 [Peronospora effusa]|uniref:Major facilitator superfamily (MFS) profile domain-containing protein n=1 Tax=Peronospora effusa TaxID=542832 RepID=A0A3M6VPC3_9STRA|nr:hypothetical protein DD238_006248 [Peronospora effusa]UIZ29095.1 hypothetical protein KXD40_007481 [Peronospora effusa]